MTMTTKSILAAALTVFAATIGLGGAAHAGPPTQVTYQLSGSAPVADYISYQTDSGASGQGSRPTCRCHGRRSSASSATPLFVISAQSPGSITCKILIDGDVVSQATANGAPARTVCSH